MSNFDRIAGYEREKKELASIIDIFNNKEKYEKKGARLPKGIILYGEHGTGKTLFAQVMASECNMRMIKIDFLKSTSISKQLKDAFAEAKASNDATLIFFDEMDKLLPNSDEEYYTNESKMLLSQLLTLMDGMDSDKKTVVVATCNGYESMPQSIVRAGRFDKKIALSLPDLSSRVAIIKKYAERSNCRFALSASSIARLCSGFSCAEISTLINECIIHSEKNNTVSEALIMKKIAEISEEDSCKKDRSSSDGLIYACRNLGAFVVGRCYDDGPYVLSLEEDTVCSAFFNSLISNFDDDYDDDYDDEEDEDEDDETAHKSPEHFSKRQLTAAITVLLGGYAAEEIILGEQYDNVIYHLHTVDHILVHMLRAGMFGLGVRYDDWRNNELMYKQDTVYDANNALARLTEKCYERAKAIIRTNEELIRKLLPILAEKELIGCEDAKSIIESLGGICTDAKDLGINAQNKFAC